MTKVSRTELAKLAGVAPKTVTVLAYPGARLAEAVRGRGMDLDHPAVQAWLQERAQKAPRPPLLATQSTPRAGAREITLDLIGEMPIRDLLRHFEHVDDLNRWLDAAKKLADTRAQDLRNLESEGRVVQREAVRVHVFGAMEASHVRLLSDAPKTITRRLYGMARAGESARTAEKVTREIINSHLAPVIASTQRAVPPFAPTARPVRTPTTATPSSSADGQSPTSPGENP